MSEGDEHPHVAARSQRATRQPPFLPIAPQPSLRNRPISPPRARVALVQTTLTPEPKRHLSSSGATSIGGAPKRHDRLLAAAFLAPVDVALVREAEPFVNARRMARRRAPLLQGLVPLAPILEASAIFATDRSSAMSGSLRERALRHRSPASARRTAPKSSVVARKPKNCRKPRACRLFAGGTPRSPRLLRIPRRVLGL